MISRKQESSFIPAVSVLTAALLLSANALAATPSNTISLRHNEQAAQRAIVNPPSYRAAASTPRGIEQKFFVEATLAQSEQAARCAIASAGTCAPSARAARVRESVAAGETTLAQSERAAQRVIVDPSAYVRAQQAEPVAKTSSVGE